MNHYDCARGTDLIIITQPYKILYSDLDKSTNIPPVLPLLSTVIVVFWPWSASYTHVT